VSAKRSLSSPKIIVIVFFDFTVFYLKAGGGQSSNFALDVPAKMHGVTLIKSKEEAAKIECSHA